MNASHEAFAKSAAQVEGALESEAIRLDAAHSNTVEDRDASKEKKEEADRLEELVGAVRESMEELINFLKDNKPTNDPSDSEAMLGGNPRTDNEEAAAQWEDMLGRLDELAKTRGQQVGGVANVNTTDKQLAEHGDTHVSSDEEANKEWLRRDRPTF
jgi:sugar phosphate isomerase/epimerase